MIVVQADVEAFGAGVECKNETGEVVSRTVQFDTGLGTVYAFKLDPVQAERLAHLLGLGPEEMEEEKRRQHAARQLTVAQNVTPIRGKEKPAS